MKALLAFLIFLSLLGSAAAQERMPMEEPRQFRMTVNPKTAKALGITIPQAVLLRADEVIQ